MKKTFLVVLFAVAMFFNIPGMAKATMLTFDDITNITDANVPIPNGYGGLDWDNFWVNWKDRIPPGGGFQTGVVSGEYAANNGGGDVGTITSSTGAFETFDFIGTYLTAGWQASMLVTVEGYNDSTLNYTSTVSINNAGPTWFDFDYTGINKLVLFSPSGTTNFDVVMDDFTFNPVPEPATVVLLGIGLAGFAGATVRRRLKRVRT